MADSVATFGGWSREGSGDAKSRAIALGEKLMAGNTQESKPVAAVETVQAAPVQEQVKVQQTLAPVSEEQVKVATDAKEAVKDIESEHSDTSSSKRYADMVKRERELRQRELALKRKEEALSTPKSEVKAAEEAPKQDLNNFISKEELLKNPFGVMAKLGLTYDQLTEMALASPNQEELLIKNELSSLKEELARLREETTSFKKSAQEREESNYNNAINQLKKETQMLVDKDPKFEVLKAAEAYDDVVDLIELTYKEEGILLSVEEAALQIEDYLVSEAEKFARLDKIKGRLTPKEAEALKTTESKTTNQIKSISQVQSATRPLTREERAMRVAMGEKFER